MPEGDTIHKVAAALRPRLEGQTAGTVTTRGGQLDALAGLRVLTVDARGKHLLIEFEGDLVLRSHLGLYGSWHRYAPGERWRKPERQASLVLATARDVLVCFNAREVELVRASAIRHRNFEQRLGPDLLAAAIDLEVVVRRARELLDDDTEMADVLLDQRVASGLGNVYKSEVLFLQRLNPRTRLGKVPDTALRQVYATGRALLQRNLGGGPRVTRFERDGRGVSWVYGRAGEACLRCDAEIQIARLGERHRSTYWCPTCQHR